VATTKEDCLILSPSGMKQSRPVVGGFLFELRN
jgi:hypothetical protein